MTRTHTARIHPIATMLGLVLAGVSGCADQPEDLATPGATVRASSASSGVGQTTADPRLLEAIDLYTGVAGRVDDDAAREMIFGLAEEIASPLSRMWVARAYSRGRMGIQRDTVHARALAAEVIDDIRGLAEEGDVEAVFLMGTAFDEGLGVEIDYAAAFDWHRRAGEQGHVLGAHNVGNQYAAGRGVGADPSLAVEWWTLAAERGDAITQLRLGEAYEAGNGVPADTATALEWFRKAAALGNAQAAASVARLTA